MSLDIGVRLVMAGIAPGQSGAWRPAQLGASAPGARRNKFSGKVTQPVPGSQHQQDLQQDLALSQDAPCQGMASFDSAGSEAPDDQEATAEPNQHGQADGLSSKTTAGAPNSSAQPDKRSAGTASGALKSADAGAGQAIPAVRSSNAGSEAEGREANADGNDGSTVGSKSMMAGDRRPHNPETQHAENSSGTAQSGRTEARGSRGAGPHDSNADHNGFDQNELWPYYRSSRGSATSQDEGLAPLSLQEADRADDAAWRLTGD